MLCVFEFLDFFVASEKTKRVLNVFPIGSTHFRYVLGGWQNHPSVNNLEANIGCSVGTNIFTHSTWWM